MTSFGTIFREFLREKPRLKAVFVATCARNKPNSAPKMLVDVKAPDRIYYLDYKFTNTYANVRRNPRASVSFMNDRKFKGFRMSGECRPLVKGPEWEAARKEWEKRLTSYQAGRIVERIRGEDSPRAGESALPKDFLIMRLKAKEASVVEPNRVLRRRRTEGK